jgi:hypothetical protein
MPKKYTKKKKKSLKKKQVIQKKKKEAKKYIDLLNLALQNIHSDKKLEIFTKEDDVLWTSGYLKNGIKKGWKVLQSKDIDIDMECNSLCMTIAILNHGLLSKKFEKLTDIEKLYIFFISYLIKNDDGKTISFDYAIRKINMRIKNEKKKHEMYSIEYGEEHKKTKQCVKNINRHERNKMDVIEDEGGLNTDKLQVLSLYKIDTCNNIDCEYLHEYHMGKSEQYYQSFEKFCNHLTFIFKGVVWLNMIGYFEGNPFGPGHEKKFNPYYVRPSKKILPLNLNIRASMIHNSSIILVPDVYMFGNKDIYTEEEKERLSDKNGGFKLWVYTSPKGRKKIEKVEVKKLENRKYILASLYTETGPAPTWRAVGKDGRSMVQIMNDFVYGFGSLPTLKKITKVDTLLGGKIVKNLREEIENTITLHWLVVHKSRLPDYIQEFILDLY